MGEEDPLDVVHTIPKVRVLSKKFNFEKPLQFISGNQSCQPLKSANPQHFHEFFTQFFLTIFLVKLKLSTAKKSKTITFSQVFHPKYRQFSREIKVEFLDKK